jgi:hypothetical protein
VKIGTSHRVRLAALLTAVGATAFLFFGFPFLGEQAAHGFAAWFDTLSGHQQHVVMTIGRMVPYLAPLLIAGMVAFGVYLRTREDRSDGHVDG